jgi:hypothetical protein
VAKHHTGVGFVAHSQAAGGRFEDSVGIAEEPEVDQSQVGEVRNLDMWAEGDTVAGLADRNNPGLFGRDQLVLLEEEKALWLRQQLVVWRHWGVHLDYTVVEWHHKLAGEEVLEADGNLPSEAENKQHILVVAEREIVGLERVEV